MPGSPTEGPCLPTRNPTAAKSSFRLVNHHPEQAKAVFCLIGAGSHALLVVLGRLIVGVNHGVGGDDLRVVGLGVDGVHIRNALASRGGTASTK